MVAIVTLGILFAGPVMEALYSGDHSLTDQLFATDLSRIMWPFTASPPCPPSSWGP